MSLEIEFEFTPDNCFSVSKKGTKDKTLQLLKQTENELTNIITEQAESLSIGNLSMMHINQGLMYADLKYWEKRENAYVYIEQGAEQAGYPSTVKLAEMWHKLGKMYAQVGQMDNAKQASEMEDRLLIELGAERAGSPLAVKLIHSRRLQGSLYIEFGQYGKAEEAFEFVARQCIEEGAEHVGSPLTIYLIGAWLNQGVVYYKSQQWDKAKNAYDRAVKLCIKQGAGQQMGTPFETILAAIVMNEGILYEELQQLVKAEKAYDWAANLYIEQGANQSESPLLMNLVGLSICQDRLNEKLKVRLQKT